MSFHWLKLFTSFMFGWTKLLLVLPLAAQYSAVFSSMWVSPLCLCVAFLFYPLICVSEGSPGLKLNVKGVYRRRTMSLCLSDVRLQGLEKTNNTLSWSHETLVSLFSQTALHDISNNQIVTVGQILTRALLNYLTISPVLWILLIVDQRHVFLSLDLIGPK